MEQSNPIEMLVNQIQQAHPDIPKQQIISVLRDALDVYEELLDYNDWNNKHD